MKEFIIYVVKSGVCLSVFLLIYQIFLRRATFFRFNRIYLLSGLILSFLIPSIHYTYDVYVSANKLMPVVSEVVAPMAHSSIDVWLIVGAIYLIGAIVVLVHNIQSVRKFILLIRHSEKVDYGKYKLIDKVGIEAPCSIINYIILNTQMLSTAEEELILKHEITHINQKHWIDLLCSEILLMLQWFNPIAWKYVKAQKENHEFLADEAVIDAGISPALYRAVLINQRFQDPVFSFSSSFNYSKPLNRLVMITKTKSSSWKKIAVLTALPLFSIFIWASAQPNYVSVEDTKGKFEAQSSNTKANEEGQEGMRWLTSENMSKVLFFVDGKESTAEEVKLLDASNIESLNVLKTESVIAEYGEKGKHGVILVKMKK